MTDLVIDRLRSRDLDAEVSAKASAKEEARTGSTMNLDQIRFRITPPSYMSRTRRRRTGWHKFICDVVELEPFNDAEFTVVVLSPVKSFTFL